MPSLTPGLQSPHLLPMAISPFYFFLLRDGGERPLILHPFGDGSPLYAAALDDHPVSLEGRIGGLPGAETLARARAQLDAALETGLRRTILGQGFALRVFATALAFLVTYLFFSIVVRDPVPILDEFSLGCLAAFALWTILARRRLASPRSEALRQSLRRALGEASYNESALVSRAERWLSEARLAAASGAAAFEAWLAVGESPLSLAEGEELSALVLLIEAELAKSGLFGPEDHEETVARCRALALHPRRAGRNARLSAIYLKARALLPDSKDSTGVEV